MFGRPFLRLRAAPAIPRGYLLHGLKRMSTHVSINPKVGKIWTITCRVRASSRSVLPLEPTAYMLASSSVDRQTFSMLCGSFFDIT